VQVDFLQASATGAEWQIYRQKCFGTDRGNSGAIYSYRLFG